METVTYSNTSVLQDVVRTGGDASRALNKFAGDTTGRSISRRTGDGIRNVFDLDISPKAGEDIAHGIMIIGAAAAICAAINNKKAGAAVLLIFLFILICFYQAGKTAPKTRSCIANFK